MKIYNTALYMFHISNVFYKRDSYHSVRVRVRVRVPTRLALAEARRAGVQNVEELGAGLVGNVRDFEGKAAFVVLQRLGEAPFGCVVARAG